MISIALCTYNGGRYLRQQLESIAAQTLRPAEIQVGDDGSTDDTLKILEDFTAPIAVRVTRNARQLGYGENFIQTAKRCTSPWIAFCDQDDFWFPDKLERCAAEFKDGVKLVAHSARVEGEGKLPDWPANYLNPKLSLLPRWFCLGFCQIFDRELLEIPRVDLPWVEVEDAHDAWIPFVAGMSGTIIWLDEPLAIHRQHGQNFSASLAHATKEADFFSAAGDIAAQLGFHEASRHYRKCADMRSKRKDVRENRSFKAFFSLLMSGAYGSGGYEKIGKRGLINDVRALI